MGTNDYYKGTNDDPFKGTNDHFKGANDRVTIELHLLREWFDHAWLGLGERTWPVVPGVCSHLRPFPLR